MNMAQSTEISPQPRCSGKRGACCENMPGWSFVPMHLIIYVLYHWLSNKDDIDLLFISTVEEKG